MAKYLNDPRWTKAKFKSLCSRCSRTIEKGEDIYYFPVDRTVLCNNDSCGHQAFRDFQANKADEESYGGR